MEVYIFYVPKDDFNETVVVTHGYINCLDETKYDLYAYTKNEDIKDDFVKLRNMDIFKLKIYNMTKDMYDNLKGN